MHAVVSYLLKHRPIVIAVLLASIVAGISAFQRLPIEAYPDVTNVQAQVITLWPGHAAEEVERFITVPVENQMNGIPARVSMRSISLFGLSVVTIVFDDDADSFRSRNLVSQQLQQVTLPTGAQASISPDSTPIGEIYRYSLRGPKSMPLVELKAIEDWVVERQMRMVPGVVDVVGFGGPTKQYQVEIDPARLRAYGISLKQVFDALTNGNRNAGGAYIEHGPQICIIRGLGLVQDLGDIASIMVTAQNGTPVTIGDLGHVVIGNQLRLGRVGLTRPQRGKPFAQADEDDVVQGIVLLRKGENALEVLKAVEEKVRAINAHHLPPGVTLVPHYDRTELIDRTLHTVRHNMIEGIGLVVIVLLVFLGVRNLRSALIVASVIPLALLGAFTLLYREGVPANLISMGAIDFGIIVDSAVVVIENIIRLREERRGKDTSLRRLIVDGVAQMGRPILFSKVILLTAFIPLFTLQRVEGRIFHPMALTLTFALIAGTLLALTAVPVLASFFLGSGKSDDESYVVHALKRGYAPLLAVAMRHRLTVIGAAAATVALSLLIVSHLGSEFLPKLNEGALWVRMTMPQSISPTDADALTRATRQALAEFPEVRTIVSQLGRPDDGTDVNGFDTSELFVDLVPVDEWTTAHDRESLVNVMSRRLSTIPGVDFSFSQVIEDNVNEAVSGIKGELGIKIFGDDPAQLQSLADQVTRILTGVQGSADVSSDQLMGLPQIQITVDRAAIARYGLAINDVQQVIETAFGSAVATQVLEGERSFDLAVRLSSTAISDVDAIRDIPVFGQNGEHLTLASVADIAVRNGSIRIYREENERRSAVKLSVRNRDLGSFVAEARAKVDQAVHLPAGYRLEWTGSFENQQRALKRLMLIVPLTLIAVLFLLMTAFDSLKLALLVLLIVPLSAVGGIVALLIAGLPLSVSAMVGFIALFGVAIQNGVLLIERIKELAGEGKDALTAIRDGAMSRVRPVVMTSAMAALGLLPAALSTAVGAETARPFATVIVGGLVSATALTLLVLPALSTFLSFRSRHTEIIAPTSGHDGVAP